MLRFCSRRTIPLLASILLLVLCVPSHSRDAFLLVRSPHASLTMTRQFLDAMDVRVLLPLGWQQRTGEIPRLADRDGILESRVYGPSPGSGYPLRARLEIGLLEGLTGGYDLALYAGATDSVNVAGIATRITGMATRVRAAPPAPDLAYEMFQLGYIEADRAMALLKALGYNTIEFASSSKTLDREQILEVIRATNKQLPQIIKVANAAKTSLLESDQPTATRRTTSSSTSTAKNMQGSPQLGGSHLHSTTAGAPQERLLLVYDRRQPEQVELLVDLLQSHVDVAAQQLVIEALVIEVNTSKLQDLGIEFSTSKGNVSGSFEPSGTSGTSVGTLLFSRNGFGDFSNLSGALEALKETGDAEILSSPSVLVLNGRQARIQVGRQIPVARTTATTSAITKGVEYFPIGIVLNLRPRINRVQSEVTMQIETIISSISPASAARLESSTSDITFSPIVDNRLVETYVRVADGTPFIIGGLLSTSEQDTRVGIPGLMAIPYAGRLFSRERVERERREVIIVITPHIVPLESRNFSYLIPKDSDLFDRFDFQLFRNAYRVRDDEVWDLKFIQQSPALQSLVQRIRNRAEADVLLQRREPFSTFLAGDIPGEDVLVRRMMRDIVVKLEFGDEIELEKVFYFEATEAGTQVDRSLIDLLPRVLESPDRAVMLTFEANTRPGAGRPFSYPVAAVTDTVVPEDEEAFTRFLSAVNPTGEDDATPLQWTIVLATREHIVQLQQALILKRLLELNRKLPLTLRAFKPGVQILFPSREDMAGRYHLIDGEVAQLFYETSPSQYYPAFERRYNQKVVEIERILEGGPE